VVNGHEVEWECGGGGGDEVDERVSKGCVAIVNRDGVVWVGGVTTDINDYGGLTGSVGDVFLGEEGRYGVH